MSSIVRSVLGAALLLTGASTAMAQSANPAGANQPVQTTASTAQTGASTATASSTGTAPAADQSQKKNPNIGNNEDRYGGHDPNSLAGARAFWDQLNPY
jgi:hypothetical protein